MARLVMKMLCFILSVYVMLLSTKRCCTDNDCDGKNESKKELASKAPVKEKECQGCSPFYTCGSCVGFIPAKPFMANFKGANEPTKPYYTIYKQPFLKEVSYSIWLPPKLNKYTLTA